MLSAKEYTHAATELLAYAQKKMIPYVPGGSSLEGMDCQGLCEYLLIRCGVKKSECNLAGSNAHYRACVWTGTPEECKKKFGCVPAGAWLFILQNNGGEPDKYKKDGIGNASHMGVYLGGNVAIHASSSRGKVAESVFSGKTIPNGGWNRVGLPKWVDYGIDMEKGEDSLKPEAAERWSSAENEGGGYVATKNQTAMYDARVVTPDGGHLNFRKAPRKGGTDMGDIPCGEILQVFEEVDSDWAKVWWAGSFGYVMREFLQPILEAAEEDIRKSEQSETEPEAADMDAVFDGLFEGETVRVTLPRKVAERLYEALLEAMAQG